MASWYLHYYSAKKLNNFLEVQAKIKSLIWFQVKRIDYRIDSPDEDTNFTRWSIERSCSADCKKFCVTMGTRTKVTYCTSCCSGNLCNTGNGATGTKASFTTMLAFMLYSLFLKWKDQLEREIIYLSKLNVDDLFKTFGNETICIWYIKPIERRTFLMCNSLSELPESALRGSEYIRITKAPLGLSLLTGELNPGFVRAFIKIKAQRP